MRTQNGVVVALVRTVAIGIPQMVMSILSTVSLKPSVAVTTLVHPART